MFKAHRHNNSYAGASSGCTWISFESPIMGKHQDPYSFSSHVSFGTFSVSRWGSSSIKTLPRGGRCTLIREKSRDIDCIAERLMSDVKLIIISLFKFPRQKKKVAPRSNMLHELDTRHSVLSYDPRSSPDPIDEATLYSRALDKGRKNL